MKIDFTNAFNEVQRAIFLKECHAKFPHIYKWVHYCYSEHSHLFYGDHIISSQAGVHQGDPLGPFLFCLVLQVLIDKIKTKVPDLNLNIWYMDDGSVCGKVEQLLQAWKIIKEEGPALGLFANDKKCELISPSSNPDIFINFEPSIIRVQNGNMDILGSPIGSNSHCEQWISDKLIKKLPTLAKKIVNLAHPHSSSFCCFTVPAFAKWFGTSGLSLPIKFKLHAMYLTQLFTKPLKIFWALDCPLKAFVKQS